MLVITRKTDESIVVADSIEITVLEVSKDRVKIGIHAPKDVKIVRHELIAARDANVEASMTVSENALKALLNITEKKGND
ncbi:MAG: carbon storage regulator [Oscillospiraceae bacterium]|jgi:carbon storage regulator|nr:carbon storage regulator [Oscillospiraceae bacterium]